MKQVLPVLWTIGALCGVAALIGWIYSQQQQAAKDLPEVIAQFERFERDIDISVPAAGEASNENRQIGEIVIHVRASGTIQVNGVELSETELTSRLSELCKAYPDQKFVLRGDAKANFEDIIKVLDLIKNAGAWNVAFATTRPAE